MPLYSTKKVFGKIIIPAAAADPKDFKDFKDLKDPKDLSERRRQGQRRRLKN